MACGANTSRSGTSGRHRAAGSPMTRLAAILAAMMLAFFGNARAQSLSSVEKIYAELAALPAPQRTKRIAEGPRREGKLVMIHTLRGALGAGHVDLFRKRYPFLTLDVAGEIGSAEAAAGGVAEGGEGGGA